MPSLYSQLETVLERVDGRPLENILTSLQQCLASAGQPSTGASARTTSTPEHGKGPKIHLHFQLDELEDLSIRFLSADSKAANWAQMVSSQNQSGQTLAHISVMLGYLRLLSSLVKWGIDLNLTDSMGSTALHYAFLCSEPACAVLLIRSGADELVLDELGRSPWDLNAPLIDEVRQQLRGIPKIDGSFSRSCRSTEQEWETEAPEETAVLRAKYLLVKRWLQRMEEDQCNANGVNRGRVPRSWTFPACLSANPDYKDGKNNSLYLK